MDACEKKGLQVLAGRLAARGFLPPTASPLGDITCDGGWSALTGQQLWVLSSILPFLFQPIFSDPSAMVVFFSLEQVGAGAVAQVFPNAPVGAIDVRPPADRSRLHGVYVDLLTRISNESPIQTHEQYSISHFWCSSTPRAT